MPQLTMVIFPEGVPEADPLFSTILTISKPSTTSPTRSGALVLAIVPRPAGQRRLTEDDVGTIEP